MTRAIWAAGPVVLVLAAVAQAQFWGPWPVRPYPVPFYPPFGVPRVTVIITQPSMTVPLLPRVPVDDAKRKDDLPINPDDVIVIRPRQGGVKNLPPVRQAPAPPVMMPEPPPKVPPFDAGARRQPPPEADKPAEAARQQALGRAALAAGEYGRAAERFEQALRVLPDQALSHFLLAQAQYAMGKYRDAVVSIHAGLKLAPDWPAAKFSARELYGENAAEHALHLERLRQAVERNPDEPALLFLYGYELWFNDRHEEAKPFFRRALPNVADPKPIERFLQS